MNPIIIFENTITTRDIIIISVDFERIGIPFVAYRGYYYSILIQTAAGVQSDKKHPRCYFTVINLIQD